MPKRRRFVIFIAVFSLALTSVAVGPGVPIASAAPGDNFTDINPDASDNANRNSTAGGRVNGLASASNDNGVFYAASEWGGIFKTTDGAVTWSHLDGHLPVVMWDVEVDPGNNNRVYATSFFDGKQASVSGIQVSTNAGATWAKPATANPPGDMRARPRVSTSHRRSVFRSALMRRPTFSLGRVAESRAAQTLEPPGRS